MNNFHRLEDEDELFLERAVKLLPAAFERATKDKKEKNRRLSKEMDWLAKQWKSAGSFCQRSQFTYRSSACAAWEDYARACVFRGHETIVLDAIFSGEWEWLRSRESIEYLFVQDENAHNLQCQYLESLIKDIDDNLLPLSRKMSNELHRLEWERARPHTTRMAKNALLAERCHHDDLAKDFWKWSWLTYAYPCQITYYFHEKVIQHESTQSFWASELAAGISALRAALRAQQ